VRRGYEVSNRQFTENPLFRKACSLSGVSPTKRQASKWRNQRGEAYDKRHMAVKELAKERGKNEPAA